MSTELGERQAEEGTWRLRNWRVRARLVALILIPTAAAVLLGGIQVFASTGAASDYARTNRLAQLSSQVGNLTQLISGERARTSLYIARGRPDSELADVRGQMTSVDESIKEVRGTATQLLGEVTGRTADQLETMMSRLDDLAGLRQQALSAKLLAPAAVDLYTTVIEDLLSTHSELIKGTQDDELFRQTRMLDALARAKESVSFQQALVTTVLVEGRFDQDQLKRFLGELSRETNERKRFGSEATADERRQFDETVNGRSADRMLFLRELILIRATGGMPLRGLDLAKRNDAKEWFTATNVVVDSMRTIEQRQSGGIVARSQALSNDEQQRAYIVAGAVLALLVAVLLITTGVARSLVRPLRRLRSEALEIAGRRLPDFVQHLRESRDGAVNAEVPPIGIFSRDEVGEVARAFDEVHREAVRLAGDEARLRSNVNAMFVNLSRRSQTLVERQLTLIERLERGERDDTRLGDLFKLDHLATRMRRNSENLLVLAGQEAARKWSEPVELMDVVRAALGEVESYDRVNIQVQSDAAIAGQAVSDVVHLLAELVENAVSFSSRDTKVIISSSRIDGGGLMLSVTDNGIGMTPEELGQANWRLANPPVVDVSVSRRMGLFVVGRLALRHSIRVQLRRQDIGGLTAMVLIPETLLTSVMPTPMSTPMSTPPVAQPLAQPVAQPRVPQQVSYSHHPSLDSFDLPAESGPPSSWFTSPNSGSHSLEMPLPSDPLTQPHLIQPPPTMPPGMPPPGQPLPGPLSGPLSGPVSGPYSVPPTEPHRLPLPDPAWGPGPAEAQRPPYRMERPQPPETDGYLQQPPGTDGYPPQPPGTDGYPPQPLGTDSYPPQPLGADSYPRQPGTDNYPNQPPGTDSPPAQAQPQPAGDEFLPIYASVESSWFTKANPTTQDHREPWSSPADNGWQAAEAVSEPARDGMTSSGLPKRTPKANLVPGAAAPPPQPPPEPISPDRLRSRLASYQQGVRKGRAELEEDE